MQLIVQPHVAASILDHYQGKFAKNCRGWLIGTLNATTATATNFVPDTFNLPVNKPEKEFKQYGQKLQSWVESIKAMFPREDGDIKIIGFYSVGSGAPVCHQSIDDTNETTFEFEYAAWSIEYSRNTSLAKGGIAIHLDIRIPVDAKEELKFLGKRFDYTKDPAKAGMQLATTDIEVRIVPETRAANTVADYIVRQAYGETSEETSVQVLNLDRVLSETSAPENGADDRIKNIFNAFEASIASTKNSDVTRLVAELKQQQADASAANGENLSEVRKNNALMIKLVVTRMQEYLQAMEQSLVRGGQRGRFDRR
ncbi:Hypothetical protein, putative [Bodo saltans]|uniref:JAB1/MPN/MOV34 metalloenzyme domain-containing protein n=1 Tax=Bodo saltans TaxID=75058 RepID=A0A0S4IL00_BODSA|nr:Hypothetical protein, putative [Bodo saltans]|eukprot:CUE69003.1 Hypothetical protein, putative [Bodo saltans]